MTSETVSILVTGVSGFIATHVAYQLLQAGHKVRGTVRSLGHEEKIKPLRDLCPGSKHKLELFEANLDSEDGWEVAVSGCTYVLHTASPVPIGKPKDEMEVIRPAVDGTKAVLRACRSAGGVKRVVFTSSIVAIMSGGDLDTQVFSEDDWTDLQKAKSALSKSKTLAERAAWDFVAELPADERFELCVLNPCMVLGPVLCGAYSAVMELPKRLLSGALPAIPHIHFGITDVRDVARAHVVGMTLPEAASKRFLLAPQGMWMEEIAAIFREEFGPMGYKVPRFKMPYVAMWLCSFFNAHAAALLANWGQVTKYDSNRMSSILGIKPYRMKETLLDMAHSMIQKGFIHKSDKYQPKLPDHK